MTDFLEVIRAFFFQVNCETGFVACVQVMSKCCACKFLYGSTTLPEDITKLENALETQMEFKTETEFYRKNGLLSVYAEFLFSDVKFRMNTCQTCSPCGSMTCVRGSATRMWANAQRDGRPVEYRWRPMFNAAKFGWRPLVDCRAVTLPRRETRWNMLGCPKLANRSQPLVGRSSLYIVRTCGRDIDV